MLASIWSGFWLTADRDTDVMFKVAAGAVVAIVAQFGDLVVSAVKRKFGVKDTSGLIPGHGGILDRLDGMLMTAPWVAFAILSSDRGWI